MDQKPAPLKFIEAEKQPSSESQLFKGFGLLLLGVIALVIAGILVFKYTAQPMPSDAPAHAK